MFVMLLHHGPLHLDNQRQDDQLEPIYDTSVPGVIDDRDVRLERVWEIRAGNAT